MASSSTDAPMAELTNTDTADVAAEVVMAEKPVVDEPAASNDGDISATSRMTATSRMATASS